MSMPGTEGGPHNLRGSGGLSYLPGINSTNGGGTYTGSDMQPSIKDYENFFGPSARDIKDDTQRNKRTGRLHLPDLLRGHNQFLTDRVDGLITDAASSPFTSRILPYKYIDQPDAKLKWNVYSFDEGFASRVPYESAARVLTQSKSSFSGYMVRQGMSISLEHNFMMKPEGRENFRNQMQQLVGSIQYTNDLDVHIALVQAPSYEKKIREKYYVEDKSPMQVCREYVDLFGFMQKNPNALDILIEEAKSKLKSWGGPMPDFLLCNSKLTFQLTMTPEKTNWFTNGYDGQKRLKTGPDIASYRGISVIHSRCFSMEGGTPPRDILRRRVRVAEYYRILPNKENHKRDFTFYNEERDTWFSYSFEELVNMALIKDSNDPNQKRLVEKLKLHSAGAAHMAQPYKNPTPSYHLAMEIAEPLGVSLEGATDLTAEIVKGSAYMALESGVWDVGGTFLTENIFLAFGAISWNKFFMATMRGAGRGEIHYIPPEKYYFESNKIADFNVNDSYYATNADALGKREESELRKYLTDQDDYVNAVTYYGTNGTKNANSESAKLQLALLFQSICNYPRIIGEFDLMAAKEHIGSNLSDVFKLHSHENAEFASCIRFRNWMRYGVSSALIRTKTGGGATARMLNIMDNNVTDESWKDVFNTTSGYHRFKLDDTPTMLLGDDASIWKSRTVFAEQHDDGLAYLREPGAFLAPNHFADRVGDDYNDFAAWAGANLILTTELINVIFKTIGRYSSHNSRNFVDKGCFIIDLLTEKFDTRNIIRNITDIIKKVQTRFKSEGVKNRISLSKLFQDAGIVTALVQTDYTVDLDMCKFVWTWPKVINSIDEIWCHENDYRIVLGGNPVEDAFPSYQVGSKAIELWHAGLDASLNTPDRTAPVEYAYEVDGIFAKTQALSVTDTAQKTKFNDNWAFTRILPAAPDLPSDNIALRFLTQIYSRFVYDQTEHTSIEDLSNMLQPGQLPLGPQQRPKKVEPVYDVPGGRYNVGISSDIGRFKPKRDVEGRAEDSRRSDRAEDPRGSGSRSPASGGRLSYSARGEAPPVKSELANIEIVVVRPNIEHQMLGIIMGQGGENLGHTLWGQTELSCYDDSMHGIWGMSYKYHERAIVFNEKNLVRLWDVAYDGYTGGKDETCVDWNRHDDFATHSQDISVNYRGPSMMVMAFAHADVANVQRNWPSPIVFHDNFDYNSGKDGIKHDYTLAADPSNAHLVNFKDMKVFDRQLYKGYKAYYDIMPDFTSLHQTRKCAGMSTVENETFCDALAFQGTMKVVHSESRCEIEHIQGSGHHGPDYIGASSVRAGKGYKTTGGPTLSRMI